LVRLANGAILKQSQIVTTHNPTVLFDALPLQLDVSKLTRSCRLGHPQSAGAPRVKPFFAVRHPGESVATLFADLRRSQRGDRDDALPRLDRPASARRDAEAVTP
jgi:hypothetical protein